MWRVSSRLFGPVLIGLALTGCVVNDRDRWERDGWSRGGSWDRGGSQSSRLEDGRRVRYRCDDGDRFTARWYNDSRVEVTTDDREYRLLRTAGLFGSAYESRDGDVRLAVSGDSAELRVGNRRYRDCRERD